MSKYKTETVERPEGLPSRGGPRKYPIAEVMATASTGRAVRITLNGASPVRVQNSMRSTLMRHGYVFHYQLVDGELIAWAEKRA